MPHSPTALKLTPVQNRSCGSCNVCCKQILIDAPELKKPPGVLCHHCDIKRGCSIHSTRPTVCRDWFCAWWFLHELSTQWRPDRSGLLIEYTTADIPDDFLRRVGLKVTVLKSVSRLTSRKTIALLCGFALQGIPLFIATKAKPGYTSGKAFLNSHLLPAAKKRDKQEAKRVLVDALDAASQVDTRLINFDK